MIFLRCISFLLGSLIVMGAPFFLLPEAPQRASEIAEAVKACLVIALLASGFLLVGVAGHHMKRSMRARLLAGVLLAFPILGSVSVLLLDIQSDDVWIIGPLLCSALFMFYSFVFPGRRGRPYRALRPREPVAAPVKV